MHFREILGIFDNLGKIAFKGHLNRIGTYIYLFSAVILLSGCSRKLVRENDHLNFHASMHEASVTVYPVNIVTELSQRRSCAAAESLAVRLGETLFSMAAAADDPLPIPADFEAAPKDQARKMCSAFSARMKGYPPPADYALYAEYFLRSGDKSPVRVHYYITDYDGNVVDYGILTPEDVVWQIVRPQGEYDLGGVIVGKMMGK